MSHHRTLLNSANDTAHKLHEQLQGIGNDKTLAAQQHLSTTKLSAKLDKQVPLVCMPMAVTHIQLCMPTGVQKEPIIVGNGLMLMLATGLFEDQQSCLHTTVW